MNRDILIGVVVLVSAVGTLVVLVAWSHRQINQIKSRGGGTVREIRRGDD